MVLAECKHFVTGEEAASGTCVCGGGWGVGGGWRGGRDGYFDVLAGS